MTRIQKVGNLFLEARLNEPESAIPHIANTKCAIEYYVRAHYAQLQVGQVVRFEPDEQNSDLTAVEEVRVMAHDQTESWPDTAWHVLAEQNLHIQTYHLSTEDETITDDYKSIALPNVKFANLWPAMVYADGVAERTLRTLIRTIELQTLANFQSSTFFWQNTVLFQGSPGCGKTTLSHALAQRLSICLNEAFPKAVLLNVKAGNIYSQYLGGSAKSIMNLFDNVKKLAENKRRIIFVCIDEVNTLVNCRKKAAESNELSEDMRSTDQILRELDSFRYCNNVIFMFTTNVPEVLDEAFLDRCCIIKTIKKPHGNLVHEIMKKTIEDFVRLGVIDLGGSHMSDFPWDDNRIMAKLQEVSQAATEMSSRDLGKVLVEAWAESRPTQGGQADLYKVLVNLERLVCGQDASVNIKNDRRNSQLAAQQVADELLAFLDGNGAADDYM